MKTRKMSIKNKLAIYISVITVISFGLLGLISYLRVSDMLINQSKEDAMGLATVAANEVDGDLFAAISSDEDEAFATVYDALSKYKQSGILTYIYTMEKDGDKLKFVVDTDEEEPADLGEEYEWLPDMAPAFEGTTCCDQEISKDEWGQFFSAYAPIKDSLGKVVGIVGCDIEITEINQKLSALRNLILALVAGFAFICVTFAVALSRKLGSNLERLFEKVQQLSSGDGDLTQKLEITSGDELEAVANQFNVFIEQIQGLLQEIAVVSNNVDENGVGVKASVADCQIELTQISQVLEELSARMEQTSASASIISENLKLANVQITQIQSQATGSSQKARDISQEADELQVSISEKTSSAKEIVENMQVGMQEAAKQCEEVYKIDEITTEILKVASKTQMLALNANIEAARAGTFGKGFSVIASEIGDLSKQISVLVGNIQETNQNLKNAVESLIEDEGKVSEFLETTVLADYDVFAQVGKQYRDNMDEMSDILIGFTDAIDKVQGDMDTIRGSISEIDGVISDASDEVTNIHGNSLLLVENMEKLVDSANQNSQETAKMTGQIGRYKF